MEDKELIKISRNFDKKSLTIKLTALVMLGITLCSVSSLRIANATGLNYLYKEAESDEYGGSKINEGLYQLLTRLHEDVTNEINGNQSYYSFYTNDPICNEEIRVVLFNSNAEHIIFGDWEYGYLPHQYQINNEHHEHWVRPILDASGTINGGHTIFSQLLLQEYIESKEKYNGTPKNPKLKRIEDLFLEEKMSCKEIESLRNIAIAAREVIMDQNSTWFPDSYSKGRICCVGKSAIANCTVRVVFSEKIPLISNKCRYGRKIISVFPEV